MMPRFCGKSSLRSGAHCLAGRRAAIAWSPGRLRALAGRWRVGVTDPFGAAMPRARSSSPGGLSDVSAASLVGSRGPAPVEKAGLASGEAWAGAA